MSWPKMAIKQESKMQQSTKNERVQWGGDGT